jgi:hypothetical protein
MFGGVEWNGDGKQLVGIAPASSVPIHTVHCTYIQLLWKKQAAGGYRPCLFCVFFTFSQATSFVQLLSYITK